ncbi:MAG: PhzF family phenazine biosynthesis protein [Chloracidobacterium sp.]|uniref:PhzF family phenazine biosynthesis protein n=1 Tax=Chloracidobacterium validum TaxID=2821543 RepID=A0ABX8BCJ7_9BACT|nr:PhzF family phenazine biosynthesis protein [Chloracidobacterium validum]QUW04642.1 PhzF family phenazine biosynthesis protein [Chloracidobacterium validum]
MPIKLVTVDAFTDKPFQGNPAAVCRLEAALDRHLMQSIALEMNLSETAFVWPEPDGGWRLRWFTPEAEVQLCGHATLAAAHVLYEQGDVPTDGVVVFHTASGPLSCVRQEDGDIEMDFPALPVTPTAAPVELFAALRAPLAYVGASESNYLVEVQDEATLRVIQPDLRLLATLPKWGTIVTCRAGAHEGEPDHDFVSRFFAPAKGVGEDPVTGSAHCSLGPYWSAKLGKTKLVGFQASKRGGIVRVEDRGSRVTLGGRAVTVMHGALLI